MDCTNLHTAAEVLEAFRACNDVGEEIELFECLATCPAPPVGAFVELLEKVINESVLTLTIQALGKINDAEFKARLKQNDDLLIMLSKQAHSGATDLIRWSAATTIETVGFDFISVSQHLSEEPRNIAEKVVQSKVKRFADKNLLDSNDYDDIVRFWTYGNRDKLREITLGYKFWELWYEWKIKREKGWQDALDNQQVERINKFSICWEVIKNLEVRGLKEVNAALEKAEAIEEINEVFEGIALVFSSAGLDIPWISNPENLWVSVETLCFCTNLKLDNLIILANNQVHCLQSTNPKTRQIAASNLKNLDNDYLERQKLNIRILKTTINTFCEDINSINYSYQNLKDLAENLETISENLTRSIVIKDSLNWRKKILSEIQRREQDFESRSQRCSRLYTKWENVLERIRATAPKFYKHNLSKINVGKPPIISLEDDDFAQKMWNYEQILTQKLSRLRFVDNNVKKINRLRVNLIEKLEQIGSINQELYDTVFWEVDFEQWPRFSWDNDKDINLFEIYLKAVREQILSTANETKKFYKNLESIRSMAIDSQIEKAKEVADISKLLTDNFFIEALGWVAPVFLLKSIFGWGWAIVATVFGGGAISSAMLLNVTLKIHELFERDLKEKKKERYNSIYQPIEKEKCEVLKILQIEKEFLE